MAIRGTGGQWLQWRTSQTAGWRIQGQPEEVEAEGKRPDHDSDPEEALAPTGCVHSGRTSPLLHPGPPAAKALSGFWKYSLRVGPCGSECREA